MGGGGLSFLSKKFWHPSRPDNLEKVWIEEQKQKAAEQRQAELIKERHAENERLSLLNSLKGPEAKKDAMKAQVSFIYQIPESLIKVQEEEKFQQQKAEASKLSSSSSSAQKDLKKENSVKEDGDEVQHLIGKSTTERAEYRLKQKQEEAKMSCKERDKQRFDILKNAPTTGSYTENVRLVYKPLGKQINQVRCLRCGKWGHSVGDRECPLYNQNPNDSDRIKNLDPMALQISTSSKSKRKASSKKPKKGLDETKNSIKDRIKNNKRKRKDSDIEKKSSAYRYADEYKQSEQERTEDDDTNTPRFVLKRKPGEPSPIIGGGQRSDTCQMILSSDDEASNESDSSDTSASDDNDMSFVQKLSKEDQKLLFKILKQQKKAKSRKKGRKKTKDRHHKSKKRRRKLEKSLKETLNKDSDEWVEASD